MIIEEILEKYLAGELLSNDEEKLFKAYLRENSINPENKEEVEKFLINEKLKKDKDKFTSKVPNEKEGEALLQSYEKHLKELGDDKEALKKTIEENPMFSKQSVKDLIIAKANFIRKNIEEEIKVDIPIRNDLGQIINTEPEKVTQTTEDEDISKSLATEVIEAEIKRKEILKDKGNNISEAFLAEETKKKENDDNETEIETDKEKTSIEEKQTNKNIDNEKDVLKDEEKEEEKTLKERQNIVDETFLTEETKIIPEIVKKANILEEDKPELTKKLNETMEKEEEVKEVKEVEEIKPEKVDRIVDQIEEILKTETKETEAIDKKDIKEIVNSGLKEVTKDPSLALSETKIIPEIVKKANILEEDKPELTKKLNETMEKEEDNDFILKRKEALLEKAHGKVSEKESEEIINKIIESKNPEKTIKELNNDLQKKLPKELTTEITSEVLIPVATNIEVGKKILKSQKEIDRITNENTKNITDNIEKILNDKDNKIDTTDRENIEKIVKESLEKVNNDTSQSLLETGVVPKLIGKFNVPDSKKEDVEVAVRQGSLRVEKQKNGKLGENISEVSKHKEWMRVYETILKNGTANEAKKGADLISETNLSVKNIQSMGDELENNGFSRNNETAKREAGILGGFLLGKTKLPESLETIKTISKRLGQGENGSLGKKIAKLSQFQKYFGENSITIKSIERIQQLINRRNLVYKSVGWGMEKIGLKNLGLELVERYGERIIGKMATHFAQYGLQGGIESIIKQLISKGMVTAVSAKTVMTAGTIAVESTNPVGWAVLAVQIVMKVGGWVKDKIKQSIDNFLSSLNIKIKSKKIVGAMGAFFVGVASYLLSGITGLLLGIPSMIASMTTSSKFLVIILLALPLYNRFHTVDRMASPLVMNLSGEVNDLTKDQSSGYSNYNPGAPGLPGMVVPGECSVADKVVLTKQCDPAWGNMELPGTCSSKNTICNAGCGPTAISMILRHKNESYTPNTVIYGPLNGVTSPYSNMDCNGSSISQAESALDIMGISHQNQGICDQKAIGGWICAGKIVMVLADFYYNSAGNSQGHYVLAVAVQDGKIITADPYYNVSTPFNGGGVGHINSIGGCITIDPETVK